MAAVSAAAPNELREMTVRRWDTWHLRSDRRHRCPRHPDRTADSPSQASTSNRLPEKGAGGSAAGDPTEQRAASRLGFVGRRGRRGRRIVCRRFSRRRSNSRRTRSRLGAVAQDLLEARDHPLRGRVLGIDGQRALRRREQRAALVAAFERRPGPARRPRSRCADPPRRPGGRAVSARVDRPDRHRPFGLEQELDHGSSPSMPWASSRSVGRSLMAGICLHPLEQRVEDAPEKRSGSETQLLHQVPAVDREVAPVEDDAFAPVPPRPASAARRAGRHPAAVPSPTLSAARSARSSSMRLGRGPIERHLAR